MRYACCCECSPSKPKCKNFNDKVIRYLLAGSKGGVPQRGVYNKAAAKYGCGWQSIQRLWRSRDEQHGEGVANPQLAYGRKGRSDRKRTPIADLRFRSRDIPLNERTTQRRLAAALGIALSTLHQNLKALGLPRVEGSDPV